MGVAGVDKVHGVDGGQHGGGGLVADIACLGVAYGLLTRVVVEIRSEMERKEVLTRL